MGFQNSEGKICFQLEFSILTKLQIERNIFIDVKGFQNCTVVRKLLGAVFYSNWAVSEDEDSSGEGWKFPWYGQSRS